MSEYIIIDGELHHCDSDELRHYGVKGMRWGVRRASKKLSRAATQADHDKAVSSLKKHREKGSAEVDKLKRKTPKLEQKARDKSLAVDVKAAQMRRKASKIERSAYGLFTGRRKAERRLYKAAKINARAAELESGSIKAKELLKHNKNMIAAFEREISNIDKALVESGKRFCAG